MPSSATAMASSSSAANSDLARGPPIYALDPISASKSHGSMMEDLIRNMYESSENGGGDPKEFAAGGGGGGKSVDDVWKEIAGGRKVDGGDGSGFNGEITLEEYLNGEEVRVPAEFAVDPSAAMAVESQNQVLGFGNGVESGGRGRGRKRQVLDPVDRAAMQRQKRMIKNRESAARSRERKQAYTVELETLVSQLEEENARLLQQQEEFRRKRLEELKEKLIPVTQAKKPPRFLRRTKTMIW